MKKRLLKCLCILTTVSMLAGCGAAGEKPPVDGTQVDEKNTMVEETEEVDPEPVVKKVTITATGDCALGKLETHGYAGSFHSFYDANGEGYFFEKFKDIFEADDFTLINLEASLTDSTAIVSKEFNIKGPQKFTGIMTSSSVEGCSLGNNHTLDYGQEGLEDTINALKEAKLTYGFNDTVGYYTTDEGIKIALVSASIIASAGGVNEKYLESGVKAAKENGAQLIIVSCHWGVEGEAYPNEYQKQMGHKLIDAGADLIIGNHSHCLQGIEEYKGKLICYSLANFSFGANRNPGNKDTAVFQQTFTFVDGVLQTDITAKIIPSRVSGLDYSNNFQPIIAEGEKAAKIIADMNTFSKNLSGLTFAADGTIVVPKNEE